MPTIIVRPRQDGSIGYTARVRIRKSQKVVHQETMTFSTRSAAEKWGNRREVELEDPHVLALGQARRDNARIGHSLVYRLVPAHLTMATELPPTP